MEVTVVIPVYNQGQYLKAALDHLRQQTTQEFCIIVINDGSDDRDTRDFLGDLNDPQITVHNQENKKLPAARNVGFELAQTTYVWVHDADDYFEPSFLEKALQRMAKNPNIGSVGCWGREFGGKRITSEEHWRPIGGNVKNFLAGNNSISSALVRHAAWRAVGGYDEKMVYGYEDWDFWIKLTDQNWIIDIIPEVLFNYRVSEGSMVTQSDRMRPELVRQIVINHRHVYEKYIDTVIFEKEREILELRNKLRQLESKPFS